MRFVCCIGLIVYSIYASGIKGTLLITLQTEARRRKALEAQIKADREERLHHEREVERKLNEEMRAAQEAALREEHERQAAQQAHEEAAARRAEANQRKLLQQREAREKEAAARDKEREEAAAKASRGLNFTSVFLH
jgi:hypothetical protein